MAEEVELLECPYCYGEVDARASICPHCRQRLRAKRTVGYALGSLIVVLGLAIAMLGLVLSTDMLVYGALAVIVGYIMRKL
jgi:hypothetical protein